MPPKNTKEQVARNTEALGDISDRDNPVFRRNSKPALIAPAAAAAASIYMVTGSHLTKYGFYYCLPLVIDLTTVNAGPSTGGVKLKNIDFDIGPLDLGIFSFPTAWSSTTIYFKGTLVSVGRQVFKALRKNLEENPLTRIDDWTETTVEVLNLSEWMGWDAGPEAEPPQNPEPDAAITELLPKLVYLDIITASSQLATGGGSVIAGFDTIGTTRLFKLNKGHTQTNTQQFTAWAVKADGFVTLSGEGLSNVKVIPFTTNGDIDGQSSSLNQFWCGEGTSDTRVLPCTWIKGMWYWIPSIQKHIGSEQDIFREDKGLYCGREIEIDQGLRTSGSFGRTGLGTQLIKPLIYTDVVVGKAIDLDINQALGLGLDGTNKLSVKVDNTTIGFNGSGEIEDKSP
jgi:hypothetical protein